MQMIKVLIADDSALVRAVLRDIFLATRDIVVVGEAENGKEAVELTERLTPDLVIMDITMPVMDGLAAIETIMARLPTPILVLSATVDDREVNHAFTAIRKGALDVLEKPALLVPDQNRAFGIDLAEKVRLLAKIRVIRRWPTTGTEKPVMRPAYTKRGRRILAIGASTGGPKAILSIVRSLPADFPAAVLVVQHIASGFARGFATWLNKESAIEVSLAGNGQAYPAGQVLLAPDDCHMIVEKGQVRLVDTPPVNCCRPSIDMLFNSLAVEEGARVVGVLLTGMGRDGAVGMSRIRERGGLTLAQDEASCAVFGMPKAAIALNAVDEVLSLQSMPDALSKIFTD